MFSKGTFNRYLFEIESSQQRMAELYSRLADGVSDPVVRVPINEFLIQLMAETRTVSEIRTLLQNET